MSGEDIQGLRLLPHEPDDWRRLSVQGLQLPVEGEGGVTKPAFCRVDCTMLWTRAPMSGTAMFAGAGAGFGRGACTAGWCGTAGICCGNCAACVTGKLAGGGGSGGAGNIVWVRPAADVAGNIEVGGGGWVWPVADVPGVCPSVLEFLDLDLREGPSRSGLSERHRLTNRPECV